MPGFPVHHQLPEPPQTHVHCISDAIQPSQPLSSPSLQFFPVSGSFPVSQLFTSGSPSNEYSGLISFRMDWLDLLTVQGTLKSLLQHHSSKESILQWSPFFIVQQSHPHLTIGKTTALNRWTFISKAMLLLFKICLGWS